MNRAGQAGRGVGTGPVVAKVTSLTLPSVPQHAPVTARAGSPEPGEEKSRFTARQSSTGHPHPHPELPQVGEGPEQSKPLSHMGGGEAQAAQSQGAGSAYASHCARRSHRDDSAPCRPSCPRSTRGLGEPGRQGSGDRTVSDGRIPPWVGERWEGKDRLLRVLLQPTAPHGRLVPSDSFTYSSR